MAREEYLGKGIFRKFHQRQAIWFYYIRFSLRDGKRRKEQGGTTRAQAQKLLKTRLGEVVAGTYKDPRAEVDAVPSMLVPAAVTLFLEEKERTTRSNHYQNQMRSLSEFFRRHTLGELRQQDLEAFRNWRRGRLAEMTRSRPLRPGERQGDSTLRKDLVAAGTFFRWAERKGLINSNPVEGVEKPREPEHRERYLSFEEYGRLLGVAPPELRQLYRAAVVTGLRLKEVTGIQWPDVDRQGSVVSISPDNKTGKRRAIPIGEVLAEVLAEASVSRFTSPYVFLDRKGEPYASERGRMRVTVATKFYMAKGEVPDASFHTLRHTAATWALQGGATLDQIERLLYGVKAGRMVNRYAQHAPDYLRPVIDALDQAELSAGPPSGTLIHSRKENPRPAGVLGSSQPLTYSVAPTSSCRSRLRGPLRGPMSTPGLGCANRGRSQLSGILWSHRRLSSSSHLWEANPGRPPWASSVFIY